MALKYVLGVDIGTTYLRVLRALSPGNAGGRLEWETPMLKKMDEQALPLILELNVERSDIATGSGGSSYGQTARQKWLEAQQEHEPQFLCEFKPYLQPLPNTASFSGGTRLCTIPSCGRPSLPGAERCGPCSVGLRPEVTPAGDDVAAKALYWLERLLSRIEQDLDTRLYSNYFKRHENWVICAGTPVTWSEDTRQRLKQTLLQAFPEKAVEIVPEAEAALRYQVEKPRYRAYQDKKQEAADQEFAARTQGHIVFVVDIGATATTITLVRRVGDRMEVETPAWQERFGGEKLDPLFGLHIAKKLNLSVSDNLPLALKYRGRELKEQFSNAMNNRQQACQMTMTLQIGGKRWDPTVRFDKATFEGSDFAGATIGEFAQMMQRAASHYRIQPGQIAGLLVIGGGASWYFVREKLSELFPGAALAIDTEPHLTVARGLAMLPFARQNEGQGRSVSIPPPPPIPQTMETPRPQLAETQIAPPPPKMPEPPERPQGLIGPAKAPPPQVPPLPPNLPGRSGPSQPPGPLPDMEEHLTLTSMQARQGGKVTIRREGRQETISLPPHLVGTQKLVFENQGHVGSDGRRGRLIVYAKAEADVLVDLRISRSEAEQGCQKPIRVGDLGGERIVVTIPSRTRDKEKLYLQGKGKRTATDVGALIVRISIVG